MKDGHELNFATAGDDLNAVAAAWHERMDDPQTEPEVWAEFETWLAADPRHQAAYEAIDRMWSQMKGASVDPRVLELRREALSAAAPASAGPGGWRRAIAATVVMGIIAGTAFLAIPALRDLAPDPGDPVSRQDEDGAFRTAVGERSTVALPDGSSVVLNTDSRIDVAFTPGQRRVRLARGQAWFQIEKDPARPFVVEAAGQRITALGTAFDVRLGEQLQSVRVTLAEGRVTVESVTSPLAQLATSRSAPTELAPGETYIVSPSAPAVKHRADLAKIGSWREGQIVFDDDTLDSAIAEINRYSTAQIILADPALAALRVSGVFKAGHSQSFVETVTGHYPIRVAEHTDRRIVFVGKETPGA